MGGHVWLGSDDTTSSGIGNPLGISPDTRSSLISPIYRLGRDFAGTSGISGDVGIWHETYLISEGQYESIYHNMPAFGLGRAGQLVEATGHRESASKRIVQDLNWILAGGSKTSLSSIVKAVTNEASFLNPQMSRLTQMEKRTSRLRGVGAAMPGETFENCTGLVPRGL